MRSDDIAISVSGLTKSYRLFGHPGDRIKQFFSLGLKHYHREFIAIKDVSFDIRKGQTVGIIGRNGSGKSTLLQLVCGILTPTSGTVQVNGRVSALLELGAGFNPEFTGRENVYFQGALMGLNRSEMHHRFDEVASFADIGDFIDQQVRTYSSGMFVRLAFAVAVTLDPDILVVDEALAVGDGAFQAKSLKRIDAIRRNGGTILLVTHALEQVAHHCDHVLLLHEGKLVCSGDPGETLTTYVGMLAIHSDEEPSAIPEDRLAISADRVQHHPAYNNNETRWGNRAAVISHVDLFQSGAANPAHLTPGTMVDVRFTIEFQEDIARPIYGLTIKSSDGVARLSTNTEWLCPFGAPRQSKGDVVQALFRFHPSIEPGDYTLSIGVAGRGPEGVVPHDRRYDVFRICVSTPTEDVTIPAPEYHFELDSGT